MKKRTLIIAEAGVNHNGNLETAKRLIDVAVDAGVDYVKFQSFKADKLVSKVAKKADYQMKNYSDEDNSQYSMLKKLELTNEDHTELINYCQKNGVNFLSTAFDLDGLHYLNNLGLPIFKIPSGEITNYPYLRTVASFGKPIILSTGMSSMNEIRNSVEILFENGLSKEDLTILHCNTEYPTPMEDVNLGAINTIRSEFNLSVGYSDHTLGIEIPIAAVALGATVIEKHFTLDRSMPGPDHKASIEPLELINMVNAIRNIELAISGNGLKEPSKSELKNIVIARKSIHLKRNLPAGHKLCESDIIALRPGDGISPLKWNEVIGKTLLVDKMENEKLYLKDII